MRKVGLLFFFFLSVVTAVQAVHIDIWQVTPQVGTGKELLVFVSKNFWDGVAVQESIARYQEDIWNHRRVASRVFVVSPPFFRPSETWNGGGGDLESARILRNFLINEYYNSGNVIGALLVGDITFIPVDWMPACDGGGSGGGPGEIYFEDLDYDFDSRLYQRNGGREWSWRVDLNPCDQWGPNISLYNGKPEIFVSRVFPPVVGAEYDNPFQNKWVVIETEEERVEMIVRFFEKDHRFWQGESAYSDFAYFKDDSGKLANENFFPVFPEVWVSRTYYYCTSGSSVSDYLNLPETRVVCFDAHGLGDGIDICPPTHHALGSGEIYFNPVPVNISFCTCCDTFDFASRWLSVGQAFILGQSDAIAGIGLGMVGIARRFARDRYDSLLMLGELWKKNIANRVLSGGPDYIIMGDPLVSVARRINKIGEKFIFKYNPFSSTYFSANAAIKPLTLEIKNEDIILNFQWPGSVNPVDIYVGVDAQPLGDFYLWTESGIRLWDRKISDAVPFRKSSVAPFHQELFRGRLKNLPKGNYYGYVLVVPREMDMSSFSFESSNYLLYWWKWEKN